jgi:hypothetical protein
MKTGTLRLGSKVQLQLYGAKCPSLQGSSSGFGKLMGKKPGGEAEGEMARTGGGGARAHARAEPEMPKRPAPPKGGASDPDSLDPVARQAAQLAPPMSGGGGAGGEVTDAVAVRASASLEELLPALVRKVAWSGDGRKGTVRLELGAGEMAGAEVVVESDAGRVRVQLRAPAGVDAEAWRKRVQGRLVARGLEVEGVEAE